MKNQIPILVVFFFSFQFFIPLDIYSQCLPATAQIDLDANNVAARLHAGGTLWNDGNAGKYIVPKGQGVSALYVGNLWMGGYDDNDILHFAAQDYGSIDGASRYWPGPLGDDGLIDPDNCENWDRFFTVTRQEIDGHRADWADNGAIDNAVPNSILGWPGKGNPGFMDANGFELIQSSSELAPFFDRNSNGIYEPMEGDYPLVKGDESIWWVFNDEGGGAAGASGAVRLKMEIQANAFSFNSEEGAEMTTFYEFKLLFKGDFPLHDFYLSLWVDPDLGCFQDDYIGCVPEEELAFVYNADDNDENCQGVNGYGTDIPILGIKILEPYTPGNSAPTGMSKFMFINNASVGGPSPATTDPISLDEYYNYMKGIWKDGEPLSQGGQGYEPGADAYDFAFDGNPADGTQWSECSVDAPLGDKRFLMSFGPYTLNPGDIGKLSFAVVTVPSVEYPCPDISGLIEVSNNMKALYVEKCQEILSSNIERADDGTVGVFPNPVSGIISVRINQPGLELENIKVFSVNGKMVKDTGPISGQNKNIDAGNIPDGIYFYHAMLGNGKLATGKFVVKK